MKADSIFGNAKAYTLDAKHPQATTVATKGNKIIFVGSEADSLNLRSATTQIIDCQQKTLLPGIIDSHFHLFTGSQISNGVELRGISDFARVRTLVRAYAQANPDESWILAHAASYSLPSVHEALNRQHLDSIIADKPLLVFAHDVHALWLNTAALNETGLLYGSANTALQEAMSFDDRGVATGKIIEAGVFVFTNQHLPKDEASVLRAHKRALAKMASYGITSVHNMLGNAEQAAIYSKLECSGELSCRVYMPYHLEPDTPFEALAGEAVQLREQFNSELFRSGAVKFFADGVYDGKTALSLNGYPDDPGYLGESIFAPQHYQELVTEADSLGFQIATHAVGSGAVRLALDAYEAAQKANGKRDSRHRIEHIEVVHPYDIARFKALGVIASMQPLHAPLHAKDADLWLKHVHEADWPYAFAFRRLRDAGAHMALGSDWSVVSMDPFLSWHAAMNRQAWGTEGSAHYQQSLAEVIAGYTKDAAYTEFRETLKGQLKAGMLADIILVSEDIFALPHAKLDKLKVELTLFNGKLVYAL